MPCPHCGCTAASPPEADDGFVPPRRGFVRVIEDVIDTLIARNVINVTDLPDEAQAKLFARKSFRDRVGRNALKLFDSSSGEVIDDSRWGGLR